jgi:hypothetical protein
MRNLYFHPNKRCLASVRKTYLCVEDGGFVRGGGACTIERDSFPTLITLSREEQDQLIKAGLWWDGTVQK